MRSVFISTATKTTSVKILLIFFLLKLHKQTSLVFVYLLDVNKVAAVNPGVISPLLVVLAHQIVFINVDFSDLSVIMGGCEVISDAQHMVSMCVSYLFRLFIW